MCSRRLIIAVGCFLFLFFGINYWVKCSQPSDNMDESAWIFSSYYFDLAFKQKNLFSADWQALDAIDHPPLAKYLFGTVLAVQGMPITSLRYKNWWHTYNEDFIRIQDFLRISNQVIPLSAYKSTRALSAFFMWGAALVTFLLFQKAFSTRVGILTVLLFAVHPTVLKTASMALSDGIFLFFTVLSFYLEYLWLERLSQKQNSFFLSTALGFSLACTFLTKIIGLANVGGIGVIFIGLLLRRRKQNFRTLLKHGAWVFLVFFGVSYLLNPSFYSEPLSFLLKMVDHRWERVVLQMNMDLTHAIFTRFVGISIFLRALFFDLDPIFQRLHIPFNLILFSIGILKCATYYRQGRDQQERDPHKVILLNGLFWTALLIGTYRVHWTRYLLPSLPFICLILACGLEEVINKFRALAQSRFAFLKHAILAGSLALSIYLVTHSYTGQWWALHHSQRYYEAERGQLEGLYPFHSKTEGVLYRLMEIESILNRPDAAKHYRRQLEALLLEKGNLYRLSDDIVVEPNLSMRMLSSGSTEKTQGRVGARVHPYRWFKMEKGHETVLPMVLE